MAHKLLVTSQKTLVVSYYGILRSVQTLVRKFASQNGSDRTFNEPEAAALGASENTVPEMLMRDPRPLTVEPPMGLFGPVDGRLPLPGNLGLDSELAPSFHAANRINSKSQGPSLPANATILAKTDLLTSQTNHDRQVDAFRQFFGAVDQAVSGSANQALSVEVEQAKFELECSARDCTRRMKKEFASLFPERDVRKENLTVLTMKQKTIHDMSAWSEAMDNEREELTEHFVSLAKGICVQLLKATGHWADFVDPSSSQPFFGAHTNDTLAETDDRMRYLGLTVQDMGCCRVVFHPEWKANVFVGCLFTNAPTDDPLIQEILAKTRRSC